jgi:hypothetical protein
MVFRPSKDLYLIAALPKYRTGGIFGQFTNVTFWTLPFSPLFVVEKLNNQVAAVFLKLWRRNAPIYT